MSEVMNVPDGWNTKELSKCADVINSNVDKKYLDDEHEVKLCNYMDVYANTEVDKSINFMIATATRLEINKFELKKDDVIITKDSESPDDIGIPTYIKEDLPNVLCGYHLTLLRPKSICDGRFLASALQSNRYKKYFAALASGSTRFALSLGTISQTPIVLPPKGEQQRIAKILSTLDEAIEASHKLITKEKNIKKGLMHDLLSNGIDDQGKIRTPQTHKYIESELGLIPEGWEVSILGNCAKVTNSNVDKKYQHDEIEVKLCNYMDVYSNEEVDNSINYMIATATKLEIEKFELKFDDVIITKDSESPDDIGIPTHVNEDMNSVLCGYHLTLIRANENCNGKYLSNVFQSTRLIKYFGALASGSTRFALSLGVINNAPILLPSIEEQIQITNILTTQDKKIEIEEKNLKKLKELKKGLMSDLLSGRVRVKV